MEKTSQIRSVAKALKIVDVLAEAKGELALGEIATKLGLAKSTVHGLLSTLRDFGYVEQSVFTGKYKLGLRLFELGNIVAHGWDVHSVAAPYIQRLVDELGETVHLVVLDKGEVLYIDKRESRHSLRIVSQVGMRLPAHCTGVGKVLLASLPPDEVRRIVAAKGLPRFTKNTITDLETLEKELARVRAQGYAIDNEEIMDSLRCVAAPIRDHSGKVCAAISISGPVARLEGEKLALAIKQVTRTAAEISADLGYQADKSIRV
ncbi:IclR family transcriptional regulator [Thermosediminibacter oceani]|uniref:Glycerol operon regulatory protein n=1 Tax=Thermosediminibacter oceani (strain ATCC BAA-1034 / DSM 16646 / JW/IW-1228P) TaxID=555079 RepID=D9S102_THEOJ|nr:IclR family transcriptional regulator [Thermosediminibacter oceani]ADL07166.1 transcriptional regulator, IclR family [Thermosediminibacter oceani DSM 16646]